MITTLQLEPETAAAVGRVAAQAGVTSMQLQAVLTAIGAPPQFLMVAAAVHREEAWKITTFAKRVAEQLDLASRRNPKGR